MKHDGGIWAANLGFAFVQNGIPISKINLAADNRPGETPMSKTQTSARFNIAEIAKSFPETADTLLLDTYLTKEPAASARVFRVYRPTPPHYHASCDEYLYVLSGRGTFWMENPSSIAEFAAGQLLFFKKGTVDALPGLIEQPVVFLAVDTPQRDPNDIIFVDPAAGSPETFVRGM